MPPRHDLTPAPGRRFVYVTSDGLVVLRVRVQVERRTLPEHYDSQTYGAATPEALVRAEADGYEIAARMRRGVWRERVGNGGVA